MKTVETTVIMRTKNSSDIIAQTLKALFSQKYTDFELLVVDSGSTDDTLEIVSTYPHKLIKVKPEDYHPGKVLNMAIKQTNTPFIVFLNSDTVMLTSDTLKTLINTQNQDDVDAVFSRQIARPEAKPWVRKDYEIAFPNNTKSPDWMFYSIPLASMKKTAWELIPFYTQTWASEDTKWGYDAKEQGLNVIYEPKAMVMHSHNYNFKQIFNRKYVEGEADSYIFDKKYTLLDFSKQYLSSVLKDTIYHMKDFELKELCITYIRRFIYFYGYYKGCKNGNSLKNKTNQTITYGNYQ